MYDTIEVGMATDRDRRIGWKRTKCLNDQIKRYKKYIILIFRFNFHLTIYCHQ